MVSLRYERELWRQGFRLVAGVDEAGRGPLAGPVVAAAVILPFKFSLPGLDDSKKLSLQKREELFYEIKKQAICFGLGTIGPKAIDRLGIGRANLLAMQKAVQAMKIIPDYLLIDGGRNKIELHIPQKGISGGDRKCASVAAASILAKVTRDRMMLRYHKKYPIYRFDRHKGYGTREHLKALLTFGPCAIHRRSFFPVSSLVLEK